MTSVLILQSEYARYCIVLVLDVEQMMLLNNNK